MPKTTPTPDDDLSLNGLECCGVVEVCGIQEDNVTPRWIAEQVALIYSDGRRPAHLLMTTSNYSGYTDANRSIGDRLRRFVARHHLGVVVKTTRRFNSNSGNDVTAYVWSPDWEVLKAYEK